MCMFVIGRGDCCRLCDYVVLQRCRKWNLEEACLLWSGTELVPPPQRSNFLQNFNSYISTTLNLRHERFFFSLAFKFNYMELCPLRSCHPLSCSRISQHFTITRKNIVFIIAHRSTSHHLLFYNSIWLLLIGLALVLSKIVSWMSVFNLWFPVGWGDCYFSFSDNRLHPAPSSLVVGRGWAGPRRGTGLSADPTRRGLGGLLPWLAFIPPRGSTALRHSAWSADVVIHKQGRQTARNICLDRWWVNDLVKNRRRIPSKHASN
jgi:hypothetical protein